jgi:hypothetical protein
VRRVAVVLVVAVAVAPACSFALRTASDPADPSVAPECDDSIAPPVVDFVATAGILGGTLFAATLSALSSCDFDFVDPSGEPCGASPAIWAVGGIAAAIALGSGVYGLTRVSQCRQAIDRNRAWRLAGSPRAVGPPEPTPDPEKAKAFERCAGWRAELQGAGSDSTKREVVARRPDGC